MNRNDKITKVEILIHPCNQQKVDSLFIEGHIKT